MAPCMLVQLFKLLSALGARQLASRSGRKINIVLPLKKKAYMIQCQWCQLSVYSSKLTIFGTLPTMNSRIGIQLWHLLWLQPRWWRGNVVINVLHDMAWGITQGKAIGRRGLVIWNLGYMKAPLRSRTQKIPCTRLTKKKISSFCWSSIMTSCLLDKEWENSLSWANTEMT